MGLAGALPGCASAPTAVVSLPNTRQIDTKMADGRVRRIFVLLPQTPAPPQGHAVLYLLDGNAMFPFAAQLARMRAGRPDAATAASLVVVGIGYPTDALYDMSARARDLTPPALPPGSDAPNEGGADLLLDDIAQQIRPMVERIVQTDPARQTLCGHSYGGLFTLHTLFTRPAMFTRYVAASPSVWWRQHAILATRDRWLAQQRAGTGAATGELLVTVGSLEQQALIPARAALVRERRMVDGARELAASLQGVAGWPVRFQLYDGEDHGGAMVPAVAQAVLMAQRSGPPQ